MKRRHFVTGLALLGVTLLGPVSIGTAVAQEEIKVGFIGSFASDVGKSTLRGAEIAIEELNAAGGVLGGKKIKLVTADDRDDVQEGVKAYEYLAETEKVDFIISGSIDDVSLGWLPRMVEYKTPTLDTWASSISIIDKVVAEYDTYKMYFMNVASDEALATLYVDFGKDVLAKKLGWKKTVILQEDTSFGGAINGLVTQLLAPEAGLEVVGTVVYDPNAVDFAPLFTKCIESGADFIYVISSVNGQTISSQYVKLQVQMPMTGVNVGALSTEYWADTGGAGGGMSTLAPIPSVGLDLDDASKAFVEKWAAKYGDSRPKYPHFNGFNAYWGIKGAFSAAERAGGFSPLDNWVKEYENDDIVLKKDGKVWLRYGYWKPGEIEPRTNRQYTHNIKFDLTEPFDDGAPSMVVIQWYDDGTAKVVYPPKYATGEFQVPSWIKK